MPGDDAKTAPLPFGIQTNGLKHAGSDPMPSVDARFAMARAAGVFDYVDKTPDPDGSVGRGIQYPFVRPAPGDCLAEWAAIQADAGT